MFQYRQVLVRMGQGDTDREIARAGLMGRPKAAQLRVLAGGQGWLEPQAPLPEDAAIAAVVGAARRARSTVSTVEPHRGLVERWAAQQISGVAIHAALCREYGYTGSASSVYRMLSGIAASAPPEATVPLTFAPGEAAQVDFGAGPDPRRPGGRRATTHLVLRDDALPGRGISTWNSSGTRRWRPGSAATVGPSNGSPRCPSGSSSITPSARSPALACTTRWCSAPTPSAPRATASASTRVRPPIRRRRASWKRA